MTIACCEWPCLLLTHYVKLSCAIIAHTLFSDLIFHLPKWLLYNNMLASMCVHYCIYKTSSSRNLQLRVCHKSVISPLIGHTHHNVFTSLATASAKCTYCEGAKRPMILIILEKQQMLI